MHDKLKDQEIGFRDDPLPLWRQGARTAGELQGHLSDYLVKQNNPLAFLPYFLTGGHDSAEALERIASQGLDRPLSRWNPETRSVDRPRARALGDIFSASQIPTAPSALLGLGKLGFMGVTEGSKAAISKLSGLFPKQDFNEGRRAILTGGAAAAGIGAGGLGKLLINMLAKKEVPEILQNAGSKLKFNSLDDFYTHAKKMEEYPGENTYLMKEWMNLYDNLKSPESLTNLSHRGKFTNQELMESRKQVLDDLGTFSPKAKAEANAWRKSVDEYDDFWYRAEGSGADLEYLQSVNAKLPKTPKYYEPYSEPSPAYNPDSIQNYFK